MDGDIGWSEVHFTAYFREVRWKRGNDRQTKALARARPPIPLRCLVSLPENPKKWPSVHDWGPTYPEGN
jgi:hypothetical protein